MISVTREQFEVRSELEAFHIPTGAVFSAYPYSDPDDMLQSITVNWGRAGAPIASDYAEQIRAWHLSCCLSGPIARLKIGWFPMPLET